MGTDTRRRDRAGGDVDAVAVIGASAGGIEPLGAIVASVPADLRAAVLVVLHLRPSGASKLAAILGRRSAVPVAWAEDGAALTPGRVLVAPPDHHLLVVDGRARLTRGPRVNNHRPAVDPLLESVASAYGPRALGVLLSGTLDDGVAGLAAVRHHGGVTAVQDPDEALHAGMPVAAIEAGVAGHVLPAAGIADLVSTLGSGGPPPMPLDAHHAPDDALAVIDDAHEHAAGFRQAALSCPACGGTLWEGSTGAAARFECRVGHRYSPAALVDAQGDALEEALWAAHRALLERADLCRRMAKRAAGAHAASALRYERHAEEAGARAEVLHEFLHGAGASVTADDA
jgi:two-component system chemotaxis response regulator CheB